jgi:hypothetical protein
MATQNNIKVFGSKKTKKQIDKVSFEDTKGVIRIRIPKKTQLRNSQRKKYKRTNNDLHNIHIKLKGYSESVYRRRPDYAIARRKSTKGQTTAYKTYT